MLVRKTGGRAGRHTEISPETSDLRFLTYRRTKLGADCPRVEAESGGEEVALFVLEGRPRVTIAGQTHELDRWDAVFVPPGHTFVLESDGDADIAEGSAPAEPADNAAGEPVVVHYKDTLADEKLYLDAGQDTYSREVVKLIDHNVPASRLLCGLTLGRPGNWTSWSPHEHAAAREEIYLYIDMPEPAFGIQMVYEDLKEPAMVEPVFQDDAVVITKGYHPNTGIPGYGIKFLWMMAAIRPGVDREWADMNDQPEFAGKY